MSLLLQTFTYGTLAGIIHFILISIAYKNPFVDKHYKKAAKHPACKKWDSQSSYILSMFLGTQLEIYALTFGYLWLAPRLPFSPLYTALALGGLFAAIRVYPRFWNMWIQSSYPNSLLCIEFINGLFSTYIVIVSVYLLKALF